MLAPVIAGFLKNCSTGMGAGAGVCANAALAANVQAMNEAARAVFMEIG
jgi:hypothetical protein